MFKRILIVEDDEAFRKLFFLALQDTPYQLDFAESGEKGLELFEAYKYDLIFLDLYMPGMNGIEVLSEIRKMDENVQVHILSAFCTEFLDEIKQSIVESLKFEMMHKSLTIDQIALITNSVLEESKVLV